MRFLIVIALTFVLCALVPPNPEPVYRFTSKGEPVMFMVPAHDPALGPEQSISTQVTVDLVFEYVVTNFGTAPAYVQLCAPGSTQSVELQLDDGTVVGFATFPLVPVGFQVQPGATVGPATVLVGGLAFTWQTHLGNLPATEGPPGTNIKLRATFPRQVTTQSSGCRIKQSLRVNAQVKVHIS